MNNKAIEELRITPIWGLYEKGQNYHRMTGIYTDTDRNHRMYNGNQWEGAKLGGIEPIQKNFIKPIVKYKLAVIHDNLYAIHYSSQNFSNEEFHKEAEHCCDLLNNYAHRIWEQDKMDKKGRKITKQSAINDEGILYIDFDREKMMPINEVIKKSDIYYGDENEDDIQAQPYILIRRRRTVAKAIEYALQHGVSEEMTGFIIGDNDTFEESGEAAKLELDDRVTLVYKMYKKDNTVHFSVATRYLTIVEDVDIGISLYPVAHMNWEDKEGSARGEGEVRYLIPNQLEVNRTEMRRALTVKNQAYPQKVVDTSKVSNPNDVNQVGGVIKSKGQSVDDVKKIVGILQPAQMSPDVRQFQDDLITITRELAGAGDIATGQVNPESASGRAILAVQQASQAPMTEQKEAYKYFIEDVARIWLEYFINYSENGLNLQEETVNPQTQEKVVTIVNIPQSVLQQLQAVVKIDVTPKSAYDKFVQEKTLENFFVQGYLNIQKLGELEIYVKLLDDDSTTPKVKLLEAIKYMKEQQMQIAKMQSQAQLVQQRFNQFINQDLEGQTSQIADARRQVQMSQVPQSAAG